MSLTRGVHAIVQKLLNLPNLPVAQAGQMREKKQLLESTLRMQAKATNEAAIVAKSACADKALRNMNSLDAALIRIEQEALRLRGGKYDNAVH